MVCFVLSANARCHSPLGRVHGEAGEGHTSCERMTGVAERILVTDVDILDRQLDVVHDFVHETVQKTLLLFVACETVNWCSEKCHGLTLPRGRIGSQLQDLGTLETRLLGGLRPLLFIFGIILDANQHSGGSGDATHLACSCGDDVDV